MNFLDIIINNSNTREARLYPAAKRASEKPDTGVTINVPAAYNVIKDSAGMAIRYLPHFIFGSYPDPFEALKGKFSKQDVIEFVEASHRDDVIHQLLVIILDEIGAPQAVTAKPAIASDAVNPYGDYESYLSSQEPVKTVTEDPVSMICRAFAVKA